MKLLTVLMLCAVAVGCGYGSHSTMPPQPGTTPTIAQFVPASATHGDPGFMLEVDGTNFGSKAFVTFNGAQMTTMWVSSIKVMATIPQSAIASAATVSVIVTNPATPGGIYGGGTAAASSQPMNFTIN
jgi:hypothetical protein